MLTQYELADLRAKAEEAQKYGPESWHVSSIDHKKNVLRMLVAKPDGIPWYRAGEACTNFCNAANPATILQLLDMVERLEKEADWLGKLLADVCKEQQMPCFCYSCPITIENCDDCTQRDWREAARKAVETVEKEAK